MNETKEMKAHLLDITTRLLERGFGPENLTVRTIAQEANVAVGLINYHFGSKENLLIEAVNSIIKKITSKELIDLNYSKASPYERLIIFLETISGIVLKFREYSTYLLNHQTVTSRYETPEMIVPILKEIKPKATDYEIKWLAIQIVSPLQFILLNEEGFYSYIKKSELDFSELLQMHLKQLGVQNV